MTRVLFAFVSLAALLAVAIGAYYALSLFVLYLTGRLLPLAGRRRKR